MQPRQVTLVGAGPWGDGRALIGRADVPVTSVALEALTLDAIPAGSLLVLCVQDARSFLSLLRALRADARHVDTEVVVAAPEACRDAAMSASAAAFLPAPFSIAEFRDKVFPLLGLAPRRHVRVPCDAPIEVTYRTEAAVCRIVDVSAGGCFIAECDHPVDVGANCRLHFTLGRRAISVWGKIVSASKRQVGAEIAQGFGVSFVDADKAARNNLSLWLAEQVTKLDAAALLSVSRPLSFVDRTLLTVLDSARVATLGLRDKKRSNLAERLLPHEWTAVSAPLDPDSAEAWIAIAVALREHLRTTLADKPMSMDLPPVFVRVETYLAELEQFEQGDGHHLPPEARAALAESLLMMLRELVRLRDYYNAVRMPDESDFLPNVERAEDYVRARTRLTSEVAQVRVPRRVQLVRRARRLARWAVAGLAFIDAWAVWNNTSYFTAVPAPSEQVAVLIFPSTK